MREFIVRKGCLGYTITIGCQVCGFTKVKELKKAICEYLDDPEGTERKYYSDKGYAEVRDPYLTPRRYPDDRVPPALRGEEEAKTATEQAQVNATRR